MVILIGGTGCTGKTLLANKLLRKQKLPFLSIDHLMMGLYRGSDQCNFTPMDDQFELGAKLWPVIKGIIMTNIENEYDIVLEGYQILPQLVRDFPVQYLSQILSLFIFFSGDYIKSNIYSHILQFRNVIEKRTDNEDITVSNMLEVTGRFKEKCMESDVKYFEIDGDYRKNLKSIYEYIISQIKKQQKKFQ